MRQLLPWLMQHLQHGFWQHTVPASLLAGCREQHVRRCRQQFMTNTTAWREAITGHCMLCYCHHYAMSQQQQQQQQQQWWRHR
jgi:hypothetical protein